MKIQCEVTKGMFGNKTLTCEIPSEGKTFNEIAEYWLKENKKPITEENIYEVATAMDEAGNEKAQEL